MARMYDDESDYSEEDEDLGYSSEENVTDNSADEDPEEEPDYTDMSEQEEDEDDEEEKEREEQLKRTLAHVSFEQLAEIKSKMGMQEANRSKDDERTAGKKISKEQILKDVKGAVSKLNKKDRPKRTKSEMKRSNKNSPMEMSSKRAVSRFREVVPTAERKPRDPRFDKLSGHFNRDLFEKSYSFLEEYKKSEKEMIQQQLKKEKDPEEREKLQSLLTKMMSREATAREAKRKQELLRERKKAEAELVKQGKKPYFLKRSEKRKLLLMDKYERLGEKNVDKILEKRRKKNAAKDHRFVPFKRRTQ